MRANDRNGTEGTELSAKPSENQQIQPKRGTESGTLGGDSGFADAVAAVMRSPSADHDKAEAVAAVETIESEQPGDTETPKG